MKKVLVVFLSFFCICLIYLYTFYVHVNKLETQQWKAYKKKNHRVIASTMNTKDLKKHNLPTPFSKSSTPKKSFKSTHYQNESQTNFDVKKDLSKLKFQNFYALDWKEKLAERLLSGLEEDTKVLVKYEKTLIKIKSHLKAKYYEQVIITYTHENGLRQSFRALIDPSTSKKVVVWDRDIYENFKKEPVDLTPTGVL